MIVKRYSLKCEGCGAVFPTSAETKDDLSTEAYVSGWILFDGKDYCQECAVKTGRVSPPRIKQKFKVEVEPVKSNPKEIHVQLSGVSCYIPEIKLRGVSKWADRVRLILDRDRFIDLVTKLQEVLDKE